MRKHYSATFKAQVVQDVLRGEKTITQLASEHGVHPNLIGLWRATALKRFPSLFDRENADRVAERLSHEKQLRELYEEQDATGSVQIFPALFAFKRNFSGNTSRMPGSLASFSERTSGPVIFQSMARSGSFQVMPYSPPGYHSRSTE
jgi:transposase